MLTAVGVSIAVLLYYRRKRSGKTSEVSKVDRSSTSQSASDQDEESESPIPTIHVSDIENTMPHTEIEYVIEPPKPPYDDREFMKPVLSDNEGYVIPIDLCNNQVSI